MFLPLLLTVAFVAVHPNAGNHFSALAETLKENEIAFVAYGADLAYEKMKERVDTRLFSNSYDPSLLAEEVAKGARLVFVDVGTPYSLPLVKELRARKVKVLPYYDNPDRDLSNSYFRIAEKVINLAGGKAIFANANLSERNGIGYYPLEDLPAIINFKNSPSLKKAYFKQHRLDPELPLLVFIGGADKGYEAAYLDFFEKTACKFDDWNFLLHRHPRAASEGICDSIFTPQSIALGSLEEAIGFSDVIVYHQTTTALKGPLTGTPTFKWGGEPDALVKSEMAPIFSTKLEIELFLQFSSFPLDPQRGLDAVGFRPDWKTRFLRIVQRELL